MPGLIKPPPTINHWSIKRFWPAPRTIPFGARGVYPETLEALIPQFLADVPHDVIGGQPLHYRRGEDGKFLLLLHRLEWP